MGGRKSQRKPVVFVVDDEPVICQTIAIILNEDDYDAVAFDDPLKAMEASEQTTPELLISDVMMPGMTGIELAIKFREQHPECKVLLFSGQDETFDLLVRALAKGYDFHLLTKPVHPKDLLSKLRTI
jgi:DNA-binding response OmpR family regulator